MSGDQKQVSGLRNQPLQVILLVVVVIAAAAGLRRLSVGSSANEDTTIADWPAYGRDSGGSRYSPVSQIRQDNVRNLEVAWVYRTGDWSDGNGKFNTTSAFEATPLLINEVLYVSTPFNRVIALDPQTGGEKWVFDPKIDLTANYANQLTSRGVAYWCDSSNSQDSSAGRIFAATNDARLFAIDADTGQRCSEFGDNGEVDLAPGVGDRRYAGEYQVTSPPTIAGDIVIVGSAVGDNVRIDAPSGVVRGYDARSGSLQVELGSRPAGGPGRNECRFGCRLRSGHAKRLVRHVGRQAARSGFRSDR